MKKIYTVVFSSLFAFQSSFLLHANEMPIDVKVGLFQENTSMLPSLRKEVAAKIQIEINPEVNAELIKKLDNIFIDTDQFYKEFKVKYEDTIKKQETLSSVFSGTKYLAGGVITVGAAAGVAATAPVTLTAVALGGMATYSASKGVDHVFNVLGRQSEDLSKQLMANALVHFRQQTSVERFKEVMGMAPEEMFQIINQASPLFYTLDYNDMSSHSDMLNLAATKALADMVVANEIEAKMRDAEMMQKMTGHEEILANHQKQILGIQKTIQNFSQEMVEKYKSIERDQNEMQHHLVNLNERVFLNSGKINALEGDMEFVEGLLFNHLNPKEQIAALNKGFFPDMKPDDRAQLVSKIQTIELEQKIIQTASEIMNAGTALVSIGAQMGVDPDVIHIASKGLEFTNAAVSIFSSIATGNPIGAISAVVGLFAKKGPDVGVIRHQQIMDQFNALREGQKLILENQKRIFEQLQAIREDLQKIRKDIAQARKDVLINRDLIAAVLNSNLENCGQFIDSRAEYGFKNGSYPTYEELRRNISHYGIPAKGCLTGLSDVFLSPNVRLSVPHQLKLSTYLADVQNIDGADEAILAHETSQKAYEAILSFIHILAEYSADVWKNITIEDFSKIVKRENPGVSDEEIEKFKNTLPNSEVMILLGSVYGNENIHSLNGLLTSYPKEISDTVRYTIEQLKEPLYFEAVSRYARFALQMHSFFQVLPSPESMETYTTEELLSLNYTEMNHSGKEILAGALWYVELALIQEKMRSGIGLTPWLAALIKQNFISGSLNEVQGGVSSDFNSAFNYKTNATQAALHVLRHNPVFATNFLAERFTFELGKNNATTILELNNISNPLFGELQSLIRKGSGLPYTLAPEEAIYQKGYATQMVQFAGDREEDGTLRAAFYVPLPSLKQMESSTLNMTSEGKELTELRAQIIQQLAEYKVLEEAQGQENKIFPTMNQLILNSNNNNQ